jgi:hypothetical protein
MIQILDLVQPQALPQERLFALVSRARGIALEMDGVYDLALYQTDRALHWQCSVDVEGERTWEALQADPRLHEAVGEMKRLGVKIARHTKWERRL